MLKDREFAAHQQTKIANANLSELPPWKEEKEIFPLWKGVFMKENPDFIATAWASLSYEIDLDNHIFEQKMARFFHEIEKYSNPIVKQDLLDLLDNGRIQGLFNMVLLNEQPIPEEIALENFYQLHTPEHCKELDNDTEKNLRAFLQDKKFKNCSDFVKAFYIQLARMAAAWHDNVMQFGPPLNEIESAALFTNDLRIRLNEFIQKHSELENTVAHFGSQLNLIGQKLIIDPTLMVFAKPDKAVIANSLEHYMHCLAIFLGLNKGLDEKAQGLHTQILQAAIKALMKGDTKRASFSHVQNDERMLLNTIHKILPKKPPLQIAILNFISFVSQYRGNSFIAKAVPLDPSSLESYLISLCKNIGIFSEENIPAELATSVFASKKADISIEQHKQFTQALEELRAKGLGHALDLENPNKMMIYGSLLIRFLNTKRINKDGSKGKLNIVREIEFAQMMGNENHALFLKVLYEYVKKLALPGQFALALRTKLNLLGYTLLLLASHFQPGHQMLLHDGKFKQKLRHAWLAEGIKINNLSDQLQTLHSQREALRLPILHANNLKDSPTTVFTSSLHIQRRLTSKNPQTIQEIELKQAKTLTELRKANERSIYLQGKIEAYHKHIPQPLQVSALSSLSATPRLSK